MTSKHLQAICFECEQMLHTWREPLAVKNIHTQHDLLEIIKVDFEKIIHALLEAYSRPVQQIAADFFAGQPDILEEMLPIVEGKYPYHLGFEVHEPLDLVVLGFEAWFAKARQSLGINIQVSKMLRFPASQAFQSRVGAYTEIMRIWIQMNQRKIMLELFDIHHPLRFSLPATHRVTNHRVLNGLNLQRGFLPGHHHTMRQLFHDDPIWHYAIYVDSPEQVRALHKRFQELAAQHSQYRQACQNPIENLHDGSFHTKITYQTSRLELEFVTQLT